MVELLRDHVDQKRRHGGQRFSKAYSFNSIGSFFSQMYLRGDIAAIIHLRNTLTPPEIEAVDKHLRDLYRVR
jgi:hypothetical protein